MGPSSAHPLLGGEKPRERGWVFLKIPKIFTKISYLALVLCFVVSGMVSGSIKSDLGGFWFLFFSLNIFFPKVGL